MAASLHTSDQPTIWGHLSTSRPAGGTGPPPSWWGSSLGAGTGDGGSISVTAVDVEDQAPPFWWLVRNCYRSRNGRWRERLCRRICRRFFKIKLSEWHFNFWLDMYAYLTCTFYIYFSEI
jgi:hypothetical protein